MKIVNIPGFVAEVADLLASFVDAKGGIVSLIISLVCSPRFNIVVPDGFLTCVSHCKEIFQKASKSTIILNGHTKKSKLEKIPALNNAVVLVTFL